jgi:hypothetical protein
MTGTEDPKAGHRRGRVGADELPSRLAAVRQLANRDPAAARSEVTELLDDARYRVAKEAADLAYLAARLAAELGQPEEALRLIAEAEARFRRDGRSRDADRCDATAVLGKARPMARDFGG